MCQQPLIGAFSQAESLEELGPSGWELLIRQGRAAEVLGILASRLAHAGASGTVPELPREHMRSAAVLASRQHIELRYEVQAIQTVLARSGIRCVLLKGAAYVLKGLCAAEGRLVSDVDILVPQWALHQAESDLMMAGWQTTTTDAYDQHYYRTWMHEIPALRHVHRGAVLDVHHSVVPPTAGYGLNVALMLDAAEPVTGLENVYVLCDVDMVLHSAVHLMHEGELQMGFRGLLDLDSMVTEFSEKDPGFWERLVVRGKELHLQRPAFLALRYTKRFLGTAVPKTSLERLGASSGWPGELRLRLLDELYERGLRPHHATMDDRFSGLARWGLYMRSHLLRMPLHLLLPHLVRKSLRRTMDSYKRNKDVPDVQA